MTAAEANRRFFDHFAPTYNETEGCVVDPRLQRRLATALESAVASLPVQPRVLDACGGSGNASLMLHALGVTPVTVDVSHEMLSLYEEAARSRGYEPQTWLGEIEGFLAEDPREWDLIVFSSALHHLEDYARTLDASAARLAPGGLLLTIFDPVSAGALEQRLRRAEYILHVAVKSPRRVPGLVAKRVRRGAGTDESAGSELGNRAELHALEGIDDLALRDLFVRLGLDVLVHERTYEGRFGVTRGLRRSLRRPSSFHFVVRRPGSAEA